MTDTQPVTRSGLLQAVVAVCATGGMFLFVWAVGTGSGLGFGLAVAAWLVGGVLSVGIDDDEVASDSDELVVTHREPTGTRREPAGADENTSADALETLRERYARGEVTEPGFERRIERLLATDGSTSDDPALRTLRNRYAEGDLSDEQFDRKLDWLTETRTLEDATDSYGREVSTEE